MRTILILCLCSLFSSAREVNFEMRGKDLHLFWTGKENSSYKFSLDNNIKHFPTYSTWVSYGNIIYEREFAIGNIDMIGFPYTLTIIETDSNGNKTTSRHLISLKPPAPTGVKQL